MQQDIPHSSVTDSSRESSSDDFASSFQTKYQHESRDSDLRNDVNYSRKPKIIFPQSNDPRWNEWNSELEVLLPQNFTYRKTRSLSATELSESFDNFIYDFFVEKLGEDAFAKPSSTQKPRGNYENKTMKKLRRQKKNCKKAYKALIKAGCGDSDGAHELKKKWFSIVRPHNKLRLSLQYQAKQRNKSAAERRFKSNPYLFAQNLFKGQKKNGFPTFTKEEGEAYFSKTYRDVGRDHVYDFVPELNRPLNPSSKFKFSTKAPTLNELLQCVKTREMVHVLASMAYHMYHTRNALRL